MQFAASMPESKDARVPIEARQRNSPDSACFAVRSLKAERNLCRSTVNNLPRFGTPADNVKIILREIPRGIGVSEAAGRHAI